MKSPSQSMLRRLGRIPEWDRRNEDYPVRALLPRTKLTYRYWWDEGGWFNQGNKPICVGAGNWHWLVDGPICQPVGSTLTPLQIYRGAQDNDEWPGRNYDGSSVLGAMKFLRLKGLVGRYHWAMSVQDIAYTVLLLGPMVAGINWYESMFYPNRKGLIIVDGELCGGHCLVVNGVNMSTGQFRLKNSWGRKWGLLGRCYMSFPDMARLLAEDGEAAIATEVGQ
jgi:hypothetical protein